MEDQTPSDAFPEVDGIQDEEKRGPIVASYQIRVTVRSREEEPSVPTVADVEQATVVAFVGDLMKGDTSVSVSAERLDK